MQSRPQNLLMQSVTVLPTTRKWYEEKTVRYTESELNQFFAKHFDGALTLKRIIETEGTLSFTRRIQNDLFDKHNVKQHRGKYRQTRARPVINDTDKTIHFVFETRYGTPELDLRSLDFDLQMKTGTRIEDTDLKAVQKLLMQHPIIVLKELTPANSSQHVLNFYKKLTAELIHARRSGTDLDKLLEDECAELSAEERSMLQMRQAEFRNNRPRHVSFSMFDKPESKQSEANRSLPNLEKNRTSTL